MREEPLAERAHGKVRVRSKCRGVVSVHHQPSYLILFVGDDWFTQELGEWEIGQRHLRRYSLFRAPGRNARQHVARARRTGLGQQSAQVLEVVPDRPDGVRVHHQIMLRVRP